MTNSTPTAGWYADPHRQSELRYWDGGAWTDHTSGASLAGSTSPADQADPLGRSSAIVPGYSSGDPFTVSDNGRARSGLPWWAWVSMAVAVLFVALFVALGVQAVTQTASAPSDQERTPGLEPEPDDSDPEGTETYITPQRLASFDIDLAWRDDIEAVLDYTPTLRPDLAGSWNFDGRSFHFTRHFMYVWEYADIDDEGLTVAEAGEEYYSNLLFYEDIEVISRETDSFTNSQGYDVWVETMSFVDSEGTTLHTYVAVTSNGNDWLAFDITLAAGDGDDPAIARMIDSVEFLRD